MVSSLVIINDMCIFCAIKSPLIRLNVKEIYSSPLIPHLLFIQNDGARNDLEDGFILHLHFVERETEWPMGGGWTYLVNSRA